MLVYKNCLKFTHLFIRIYIYIYIYIFMEAIPLCYQTNNTYSDEHNADLF